MFPTSRQPVWKTFYRDELDCDNRSVIYWLHFTRGREQILHTSSCENMSSCPRCPSCSSSPPSSSPSPSVLHLFLYLSLLPLFLVVLPPHPLFFFLWAGEGNRTTIRAFHSIFLSVLKFYLSALKSAWPCDWLGQWNVNCHMSLLNRAHKIGHMIFQISSQYLQVYM